MSHQLAVPITDVANTVTGGATQWLDGTSGSPALGTLYANLDEVIQSLATGDYIHIGTVNPGQISQYVAKLSPLEDPILNQDIILQYWAGYVSPSAGGDNTDLAVDIYQGDPTAGGTLLAHSAWTDSTGMLQGYQMRRGTFNGAAISDWTDLYVRVGIGLNPSLPYPSGRGCVFSQVMLIAHAPSKVGVGRAQFPVSPVHATLRAVPSTNGGALWQLLNDSLNQKLRVHELYLWGVGSASHHSGLDRQAAFGIRATDFPFAVGVGGHVITATPFRMNPYDVSPIYGRLQGIDFNNEQFYNGVGNANFEFEDVDDMGDQYGNLSPDGIDNIRSQWVLRPSAHSADQPMVLRAPGSQPWHIMPLSALEILWLDNAVNFTQAEAVWDIVPV